MHLPKSVDTLNHKNVFFWILQRNDPRDVADLRICGRSQFFTAYLQMFAGRNRFANPQTKTFGPQFTD